MFVLHLNDMRFPNVEKTVPVCKAETEAELQEFIKRETVQPYSDGRWGKCFRKDGPLEWYNDIGMFGVIMEVTPLDEVLRKTEGDYLNFFNAIPNVEAENAD